MAIIRVTSGDLFAYKPMCIFITPIVLDGRGFLYCEHTLQQFSTMNGSKIQIEGKVIGWVFLLRNGPNNRNGGYRHGETTTG
jgi:hypothetical protein